MIGLGTKGIIHGVPFNLSGYRLCDQSELELSNPALLID